MKDNSLGALMVFLIAIVALIILDDVTQTKFDEAEVKITSELKIQPSETSEDIVITDEID